MYPWLFLGLLLLGITPLCDSYAVPKGPAGSLYKKYVIGFPEAKPCILLADKHGEMGCSSHGEVTGPLKLISTASDMESLKEGSTPWMLILTNGLFEQVIDQLAANDHVMGVIVHRADNQTKEGYSPEQKIPNERYFPGQKAMVYSEWNSVGNSRMLTRFNFPIWLVGDNAIYEDLVSKAKENRRKASGPQWVAQILLNMAASGRSAAKCLADRKCQPLGGGTSWATLRPIDEDTIEQPIVAVMCSTSSSSLFHDAVPAADAVVSHVVAMLAAFDTLVKASKSVKLQKEILFLFFPGEAYGYLGSTRFLWDITHPYNCTTDGDDKNQLACRKPYLPTKEFLKIRAEKFEFLLDVNQVGHIQSDNLYVHIHNTSKNTATLVDQLKLQGVKAKAMKLGLPPSSLVPFFLDGHVPDDVGAAVLTGYWKEYDNKYYSSIYDDSALISEARILKAAEVIATTAWTLAGGTSKLEIDKQLVSALLHCLTTNFRCELVKSMFPGSDLPKVSNWYVGAFQHRYEPGSPEQRFIYRFLADRTTTTTKGNCTSPSDCNYRKDGMTCVKGTCARTAAYMHQGFSPAVSWDYKDNKWVLDEVLAEQFSTVVESDWSSNIGVRVFLESSKVQEGLIFLGGSLTTVFAAVLWIGGGRYFCSKYKLD